MVKRRSARRRYSLDEARRVLPTVKHLTAEAVRETEALEGRLRQIAEHDPEHDVIAKRIQDVIATWAERLGAFDLEAKGLWLVDFDNGEGYYCWCYPEETVGYFHGYDDGFAGRVKIM
jgi:hypothetical protein